MQLGADVLSQDNPTHIDGTTSEGLSQAGFSITSERACRLLDSADAPVDHKRGIVRITGRIRSPRQTYRDVSGVAHESPQLEEEHNRNIDGDGFTWHPCPHNLSTDCRNREEINVARAKQSSTDVNRPRESLQGLVCPNSQIVFLPTEIHGLVF